MKLAQLLECLAASEVSGDAGIEIKSLCYDSRKVAPGALFFALRGVKSDGTEFVEAAVKGGAVAIVADRPCACAGVTVVTVPDARLAMSLMAAAFYGTPTRGIPVVGITGTNGKTTTTYLVEGIMEKVGVPAAVLGTISYRFAATDIPAPNTTPESVDLQRILRELVDLGARGAVMEVSSHSLEQRRADGCLFDVALFTNLTRDHLDYHLDMESYFNSKLRLFTDLLTPSSEKPLRRAVVNLDDPFGPRIAEQASAPVLTYSLTGKADISVAETEFSVDGIRCRIETPVGEISLASELLGRFNLYNILAAVGAGLALGYSKEAIRAGIEGHKRVPGRLERVESEEGITVLVDYAHTGDALENVLATISELKTDRIITIFGCGGDRDKGKRPVMGEIAARYSDLAVITSDNPRTEDPQAILEDVRAGILPLGLREYSLEELAAGLHEKGFATIESRRAAIRAALLAARPGDIVLLAGKGHEDYQIVGTEKFHFDDREEAAAALKLRG
ncbi:UDP-N-acetylmuramoylalanyl-D-glutamate--2,6-diaminopimelate ligase [Geoanaerobacter pelophilus]|uniref:UDP-N-acetylmuramoyl-L-alanyl-D-glutamate--2,6-diaminopimelate ligase n=1 Tax=Geoanaerobacter pelophilus TaxID=60036 RepID=A0ABQ0ML81_9BACT|nr:UDP-N-acetylmuramoyl-L-alanyl-D-glutamate--2,6-diaminopimelate ligase [Geoanaerobacter pelophilus]GAW67809.1 UDP-N-acetylmuramoylalanyl-D-glutamate--2,6-diaminopimelate ligase [Geoanaerobacter pelophilus]